MWAIRTMLWVVLGGLVGVDSLLLRHRKKYPRLSESRTFNIALKQRKVVGLQGSPDGLVTSHAYRYFRHPIYTGILWTALGLALLTRNPDGLLIFPALFLVYLTLTLLEERRDVGATFGEEYQVYRQTTRMFGPAWLWSSILAAILLIAISAWI